MGHLTILLPPTNGVRVEYGCNIFRLYVKSMCSVGYLGNGVVAMETLCSCANANDACGQSHN